MAGRSRPHASSIKRTERARPTFTGTTVAGKSTELRNGKMGRIGSAPAGKIESVIGFGNDIRCLGCQQRPGLVHWRRPRLAGIKRALEMLGLSAMRGATLLGLAALGGCHGGVMFNSLVLLVTVGIFVGTLLFDRSP